MIANIRTNNLKRGNERRTALEEGINSEEEHLINLLNEKREIESLLERLLV
jgi:hypothetical protein